MLHKTTHEENKYIIHMYLPRFTGNMSIYNSASIFVLMSSTNSLSQIDKMFRRLN
jgi:hypothetical protein